MNTHADYHTGIVVNVTDEHGIIRDYDCGKKFGYATADVAGWKPDATPEDLFDYSPTGFHIGVSVRFKVKDNNAVDIQPANGHSEPMTATLRKYVARQFRP